MFGARSQEKAFLAPFAAFMALAALGGAVEHLFDGYAFWMASASQYWVAPLQTLACGALLIRNWHSYTWRFPAGVLFATTVGIAVLFLWIAPQQWLGFPGRWKGFDPGFFGSGGWPYWLNLVPRIFRLVVVVPFVEEVFWRGFLLRYVIDNDFPRVPFGAFSWLSFAVVTAGFCFEHQQADWPAAAITGALFNLVAYRTRSLGACVLAHAVTNFLLGIFILRTGQWGFW